MFTGKNLKISSALANQAYTDRNATQLARDAVSQVHRSLGPDFEFPANDPGVLVKHEDLARQADNMSRNPALTDGERIMAHAVFRLAGLLAPHMPDRTIPLGSLSALHLEANGLPQIPLDVPATPSLPPIGRF